MGGRDLPKAIPARKRLRCAFVTVHSKYGHLLDSNLLVLETSTQISSRCWLMRASFEKRLASAEHNEKNCLT